MKTEYIQKINRLENENIKLRSLIARENYLKDVIKENEKLRLELNNYKKDLKIIYTSKIYKLYNKFKSIFIKHTK